MNIPWTDQEKNLLILHHNTLTKDQLLLLLPNRSWTAIQSQLKRLGLSREQNGVNARVAEKMRFGRLTVKEKTELDGKPAWICDCKCGGRTTVRTANLIRGHTKSCGCIATDNIVSYGKSKQASKTRKENWARNKIALGCIGGTWVNKMLNNRPCKNTSTGYSGVTQRGENCFEASLRFRGQYYYLGRFPTAEEAASAREKKLDELRPILEQLREQQRIQGAAMGLEIPTAAG